MEAFLNPYTLCDCLNLVELNIPDSVRTYYCYHGVGYYNGNQPFLCNLPKLKKLHFGYQFTSTNLNVMPPADYIRPVRGQDYCNFPELVECNQSPMMDAFSLKSRFLDDAPKLEKISVDKNSVFGYDSFEGCVVSKDRKFLYSVPLGNSYFATHSFASSGIKAIGNRAFFYNPFFTLTDFTGLEFIDDIFNYYEFKNVKKNKFWLPKGLIVAEGASLYIDDNDSPMIFTDGNEEDVQRWINAYSKVYGKGLTNPWEEIYQYHLNATKEEYENY